MTKNDLEGVQYALSRLIASYRRVHGIDGAFDTVLTDGEAALRVVEGALNAPPAPAVPDDWREFIAECATYAGRMGVN